MEYNFSQDLRYIREILDLTQEELASKIGVEQVTISRNESGITSPSKNLLEKVYDFAFSQEINLGKLKEMLWKEDMDNKHKLLFHGSKSGIKGKLDVYKGRANNDFGQGFYTGETYVQAISFVSNFENSSKEYAKHPDVLKLIEESKKCDYIIAPIADNRMFQIIDSFIGGEITDEQCKHCLAATNLGYQYLFKTPKAIENIKLLERGYISNNEREYYKNIRSADTKLGNDKVKLARIQYRGKGHYIDEILK